MTPARPNGAPPPLVSAHDMLLARGVAAVDDARRRSEALPARPDAPAFATPRQRIRITSTLPHRDALAPKFRAHFGNLSGDEGRTSDEAIGNLVRCNAEAFGLPRATEWEWPEGHEQQQRPAAGERRR